MEKKPRKKASATTAVTKKAEPKVPKVTYFFGLGRRKTAKARVKVYLDGEGNFTVNGREFLKYFPSLQHQKWATDPLEITGLLKKVNITAKVEGGGVGAQAQALSLALSRVLIKTDPALRSALKKAGFLRRDARKKERKKPGFKRARRAPQWQKR